MALTKKMEMFCQYYTGKANFNAARAARMAGYKGKPAVLSSVGYENLRKPDIKRRIAELMEPELEVLGYN